MHGLLILGGLLLEMGFTGSIPISFKFIIDSAITPRDKGVLFIILALLAGGVFVVSLAGLGRDYLYARLCTAMLNDLRHRMFKHLQQLSMGFHSRVEIGDIMARFSTDLAAVENAVTAAIPWAVLPALDVLFSTLLLFILEWRLACVAMLVFPLSLVGPRLFAPRATVASYQRKVHESRVATAVQENLGAQAVIKVFGLERHTLAGFAERLAELARSSVKLGFLSALVERSAGVCILILQVLVMGTGAYMAFQGNLSIGSLVSFQSLFLTLSWSMSYMTQYVPNLVQAVGGMQRIEELLRETPQVIDAPNATRLPRLSREIAFDAVTFSYGSDQINLNGVSFAITAGQSVAFVGPSGSGKSIVLNLLTRFYDPAGGCISVDGHDLRRVTQESWRAQIGMVFQESFLFNTTIRENIRVGNTDATDAQVEAAAQAAEIHALIKDMPQGYDTVVGERGGRLSGGQRQRVAIARALLRDPAVLLLDEATSALDAATEAAINATLECVVRGRTVVSVTHRLASAVSADRIFVLDGGRVAESGSHDALLAHGGVYAQLWHKQSGFVVSENGSSAEVTATRLRAIPMLAALDEAHLHEIASRFITERFPAGRTIFQEGDPGDKFYIIVRGIVRVTTRTDSGEEHDIATLNDGDHFGEIALLQDVPRTATVTTRTPSLLLALQRDQFRRLVDTAPGLRNAMDREMATRLEGRMRAKSGEST